MANPPLAPPPTKPRATPQSRKRTTRPRFFLVENPKVPRPAAWPTPSHHNGIPTPRALATKRPLDASPQRAPQQMGRTPHPHAANQQGTNPLPPRSGHKYPNPPPPAPRNTPSALIAAPAPRARPALAGVPQSRDEHRCTWKAHNVIPAPSFWSQIPKTQHACPLAPASSHSHTAPLSAKPASAPPLSG